MNGAVGPDLHGRQRLRRRTPLRRQWQRLGKVHPCPASHPHFRGGGTDFQSVFLANDPQLVCYDGEKNALGVVPIAPTKQQDSTSSQLQNGVTGFMLDMYDFLNDIWLWHSFGGQCYNVTAFQPALNVLKAMKVFLDANPNENITIFVEDYATSPKGLTKLFDASARRKYWFPVSKMPKNGGDWPILDDMISQNQRLLLFTSIYSKEASEGIAYHWRYTLESQYGDEGMKAGSCPRKAESPLMNTKTISLIDQNYFPDNPDFSTSCRDNSAPLRNMGNTCYDAAIKRWANYIDVNFTRHTLTPCNEYIMTCFRCCGHSKWTTCLWV